MKHPKSHTDIYGPRERDELPPGCCYGEPSGDVRGRVFWGTSGILVGTGYTRAQSAESAWLLFGEGPREAYLDMKAKAERCEAAEAALRQRRGRPAADNMQAEIMGTWDALEVLGLCIEQADQVAELRAQLAEVTRERDEALGRIATITTRKGQDDD